MKVLPAAARATSSSPDLVRPGALGAVLAGVAWTASGVVGAAIGSGRGPEALGSTTLNEALFAVALVGTLGGLVGLHARQAAGYGWLGKTGFLASFVGAALLLAGVVLSLLARALAEAPVGGGAPGPAFPDRLLWLGLWGALVGFALLGVATLRLGALPRWCGWLLIVCLPLAIAFGNYGGGAVLGLTWLALGYALLRQRDVSALLRRTTRR